MKIEDLVNLRWPKIIFISLAFFNGMLIAAGGMITLLLVETPSIGRLIYAAVICNITIIILLGIPMIIVFGILVLYCLFTNKKLQIY